MHIRCLCLAILVATLLLAGAGCGGNLKPIKVNGVVLLDGNPLPSATVKFVPEGDAGQAASGRTDENGVFNLTTFNTNDGAIPGDYKVTISIDEIPKEIQDTDLKRGNPKIRLAQAQMKGIKRKAAPTPVPAVYGNAAKTPLKQRVPADGKVSLELDSKMK